MSLLQPQLLWLLLQLLPQTLHLPAFLPAPA
jgi:hypothetical protein